MQLASTVWWKNGKIAKNSRQSQKKTVGICGQQSGSKEASHGVVCGSKHVSVSETRKKQHEHGDARSMCRTEVVDERLTQSTHWEDGVKSHLGGHDMERRAGRAGEALIWCRKWSGYARHRLGAQLMNRCGREMDTKECVKMSRRILSLEE